MAYHPCGAEPSHVSKEISTQTCLSTSVLEAIPQPRLPLPIGLQPVLSLQHKRKPQPAYGVVWLKSRLCLDVTNGITEAMGGKEEVARLDGSWKGELGGGHLTWL